MTIECLLIEIQSNNGRKYYMVLVFFLDFVNSLNLNDLQELSSGEKKEVWKLLTTIGQSTFSTESAYTNSSSN